MHPHTQKHAFTPIQPAPIMMEPQDRNFIMYPSRQTPGTYFSPINAVQRQTQRSFRSTTQGKWGDLHVCIAWKIYYHKQRQKKMHLRSEDSVTSRLPISQQLSCGQSSSASPSAFGNVADKNDSGKNDNKITENTKMSFEPHSSPPASHNTAATSVEEPEMERQDEPVKLLWKKKNLDTQADMKDLPSREMFWNSCMLPELDRRCCGPFDRKRQIEPDSFGQVKRVKCTAVDKQWDLPTTFGVNPFLHRLQNANKSTPCVSYPNSCRYFNSYMSEPGVHPYHHSSLDQTWNSSTDLYFRQKVFKSCLHNSFHGFVTPSFYFPLAPKCQESAYLRRSQTLPSVIPPVQRADTSPCPFDTIFLGTQSQNLAVKQRTNTPLIDTAHS